MERLRGGDGRSEREGPLLPTQSLANYGKHAFVLIAGLRVCLYRCCSIGGGHTVRNMPPLALGITNEKYSQIWVYNRWFIIIIQGL